MTKKSKEEIFNKLSSQINVRDLHARVRNASSSASSSIAKIQEGLAKINLTDSHSMMIKKGTDMDGNPDILRQNKSKIVIPVIKHSAMFRKAGIFQPIVQTPNLFKIESQQVDRTTAADVCQQMLNYTFENCMDKVKLIGDLVTNFVEEGVVFAKVSYKTDKVVCVKYKDTYEFTESTNAEEIKNKTEFYLRAYKDVELRASMLPEDLACYDKFVKDEVIYNAKYLGKKEEYYEEDRYGYPDISLVDSQRIYVDPLCEGDMDKAQYVIETTLTCLADLRGNPDYLNLDAIDVQKAKNNLGEYDKVSASKLGREDPNLPKDLKRFYMHTYYGEYPLDGVKYSIICVFVEDVILYLDYNPLPKGRLPFVAAQYNPIPNSIYGDYEGHMLEDVQKGLGATLRVKFDTLAKNASNQKVFAVDTLGEEDAEKEATGQNYNINLPPNARMQDVMHTEQVNIPPGMFESERSLIDLTTSLSANPTNAFGDNGLMTGSATGANIAVSNFSKIDFAYFSRFENLLLKCAKIMVECWALYLEEDFLKKVTGKTFREVDTSMFGDSLNFSMNVKTRDESMLQAQSLTMLAQALPGDTDPYIRNTLLSEIASLHGNVTTAKLLKEHKPQPTEAEQEYQKLEMDKLRAEIEVMVSEKNKNNAVAAKEEAESKLTDNNAKKEASGEAHAERVELSKSQAQAQTKLNLVKSVMDSMNSANAPNN